MTSTLLPIFPTVYDVLFYFAQSDGFWANLETAFGTSYDVVKATQLRQQWQSRNFGQLPPIEVLSDEVLGTANGAYSSSTNKIYLSASFLNTASSATIVKVILEEIGHYVDAQINQVDSAGDEGAIFAELVQGDALSDSQLALLRAENDWVTVMIDGQLMALDQSNPAPILVASYQGLRFATDVRVADNYAYVADFLSSTADFKIINISNTNTPVLASQYNATSNISDLDFFNGYVYAADGTSGLRLIDVSNPSSPSLKSTYNSPGDAQDVKIVGNYAYVADGTSGLQIVNISNPNSPVLQGNAGTSIGVIGSVSSVDVVGNRAYIANKSGSTGRLQVINISNPTSPTKLGDYSFVLEGFISNVQVLGNYAYVSAGNRGLKIIDISNPASPSLIGEYSYNHTGEAYDVQVVGNYAYVAFGLYGLEIIDIKNPSSPILAGSYKPSTRYFGQSVTNTVTSVEVVNNYAYLTVQAAKDLGGLWILDVNQFTGTNQPPSVGLAVSPSSVNEDGTTNLVYTFTRSGSTTNALTVNYTIGGTATLNTDYTRTGTNNAVTGTITNDDLPSVTLAVSPASVTEDGTTNLIYTFTRTGVTTNPLTVNYTLGGTATLNTDYTRTGTNNTVTFAAGSSTATVTIDPTPDTTVEPNETVILTLASGTGYTVGTTTAVTGTITNDDVTLPSITLAVSPSSVTEDGTTNLVYTFTRTGVTTNALTVNYTLGGTATLNTDYTRTGTNNTVTFAAGSSTATVTIDPTPDTTVESDETVALTLASGTGYTIGTTTAVTGTITNDDVTLPRITLAVSPSSVTEDGTTNLIYTFIRTGVLTNALTVNYTIGGTATLNTDYTRTGTNNTVTFAAGSSTATVTIDPTPDTIVESDETVALTLASGTGYTIGTTTAVTGTITNDDVTLPSITLAVSPSSVTEDGTTNLVYTFTRNGVTTNPLTVNYTIGGTATLNTDYTRTGTNNTVTFAANATTATVTIDPTPDTTVEPNETVILTLAAGTGYTVGTTTAVTGTINNDDFSQLSINNITVVEGQDNNATLTVTVNNPNPQPITVNYTTAPVNATANVDYTSKTGTITIAANTSTATISIPILNDNLNEANETFAINLSNPVNATLTNNKGIVTISDTLTANVTTTLPANVENLTLTGSANINGTGNAANNILTGNSGNNILNGSDGNDTLIGGTGNDTITGGAGGDRFTFNNPNEGIDTITDFLSSQGDKITVSAAGFGGGLAAGVPLTSAQFVLGTTALNASNRFIYNTITGGLFFDGDGTGTIAAIQIATLSSKPNLSASDILVLV
ncbi:MAG: endo-1,3-1,4-beta-glycanase ExsH [Microcystis aeruginosa BS13-02]|nr:endo-1,3-1,4-beta-glycanase ExsH [Microcystis aeruginosa BS13-02]